MIYSSQVKDIVLSFLQDAFSQTDLYDGKNEFQWSEDDTITKIMITDSFTENLQAVEKRPAIIVNRGVMRWMNSSIDQRDRVDFRTGAETYKDLVRADITVNCFSRNGLEAEKLAHLAFSSLQFFAREIRKRGAFEINSMAIGPESIVQADSIQDLSVVPVALELLIQDTWKKTFDAPRMQHAFITVRGSNGGANINQTTDP